MGFLSFLFGGSQSSTVDILSDRVWLSDQARLSGIRKQLSDDAQWQTSRILLVTHFPDVLQQLDELQDSIPAECDVRLASDLSSDLASATADGQQYLIVVAERHPLRSSDNRIVQFAEGLPCRCRIVFHVSMEDPVMKVFMGDSVKRLLRQMGMQEDEAIESSMVSRRISAAQKKFAASSFGDSDADSAADWIRANAPDVNF